MTIDIVDIQLVDGRAFVIYDIQAAFKPNEGLMNNYCFA